MRRAQRREPSREKGGRKRAYLRLTEYTGEEEREKKKWGRGRGHATKTA